MSSLLEPPPMMLDDSDVRLAKHSSRQMETLLKTRPNLRLRLVENEEAGEVIELPAAASRLLVDALAQMGQGKSVTVVSTSAELTTQQAAELLKVSRPYLIGLLASGRMPFRLVGTHRRILLNDLMEFKKQDDEARLEAIRELTAQAQELDMGY